MMPVIAAIAAIFMLASLAPARPNHDSPSPDYSNRDSNSIDSDSPATEPSNSDPNQSVTEPDSAGPPLQGSATLDSLNADQSESGQPDSTDAAMPENKRKPFKLHAKENEIIERPYWIPARAYAVTNDTTHYRWVIGFAVITKRLPNHPTTALLSRSTSKYWRGFLPRPCYVRIMPDRSVPEGNFIFFTPGYKNGPRGWLQYAGLDKKGKPHYRYWFDSI
jgi:hypothetical protein